MWLWCMNGSVYVDLKAVINHTHRFCISFSSIIFSLLLYTRLSFRGMSVISEERHKQILTKNQDEKCHLLKTIQRKEEEMANQRQYYKSELSLLKNEHKSEQKSATECINNVCNEMDKVTLEVCILIVL